MFRKYFPPVILGVAIIFFALLPVIGVGKIWILYLFHFFVFLAAANMWNLLAGFSGLLALCPAAFIGLGGYTLTILTWLEVPFYLGILAGGIIAALFAVLISRSVFRMKGIYFAIGTLVLPEILRLLFLRWRPVGGGDLHGGGAGYMVKGLTGVTSEYTYWLALLIATISILVMAIILRSKFGLGLAAIRDNDMSAASSGINVFRLKLSSFIIAAFVIGLAGAVFFTNQGFIEPNSAFNIKWLMTALLATVIGGKGLEEGPFVGTIVVVILHFQLSRYADISLLIQGAILVIIMLVVPQGIAGLVRDIRKDGGLRSLGELTRQRVKALASLRKD
jgi:branched-chain amino acid transport system permease protein